MKILISTAFAACFALGGGMTAFAQGPGQGLGGGQQGPDHLAKIDTNADGTLSSSELAAARATRFAEIDANGDGFLSAEEMTVHREAKRAERKARRHARMMKRVDTDGNGLVSRAEFEAIPKRGLMRADTNGDGAISSDEIEAMKAKRRENRGKRRGRHAQDNAQ